MIQNATLEAAMNKTLAQYGKLPLVSSGSSGLGLLRKVYAFEELFMPGIWPTRLFEFLIRTAMPKDRKPEFLNLTVAGGAR